MDPRFRVSDGGWCFYEDAMHELAVQMWPSRGGRLVPAEVIIRSGFSPEHGVVKPVKEVADSIPWARIEALANAPGTAEQIVDRLYNQVVVKLEPGGVTTSESPASGWQVEIATSDAPALSRSRKLKLKVPQGGGKYPDEFYEQFAALYTQIAIDGGSPGTLLSESNGVPRTTVHRWAKEARRRGFLNAGHRGKSG